MSRAPAVVLALGLALGAGGSLSATGPEDNPAVTALIVRARSAHAAGRVASLDKLARQDRFDAYEAVDRLLTSDVPGDLPVAEVLAKSYDTVYGDARLSDRVRVFQRMTPGDRASRAGALSRKQAGKAAFAASHLDEAGTAFEEALNVFRKVGDLREEARCLTALGAIEAYRGESRRSLERLEEARPVAEQAGDRNQLSVIDFNRAVAMEDLGRLDEALQVQASALSIARETHDLEVESLLLVNRASILLHLGRVDEAREGYTAAAEAGARAGNLELQSKAWFNLGAIAEKADDAAGMERNWNKALALARRSGLPVLMADPQVALSSLARKQGRWAEARRFLDAARAALAQSDDPQRLADLDYHEALYLTDRGRYAEALVPLDAAARRLAGLDTVGSLSRIDASRSVALYYLGDYEGAVRQMRTAIGHAHEGGYFESEADHHAGLGYLLLTLGDSRGGMAEVEEAVRLNRELGEIWREAYALDLLGFSRFSFGDREGGRTALESGLALAPGDGDVSLRGDILMDLAQVELASGAARRPVGRQRLQAARDLFTRAGDPLGILHVNLVEADTALADGDASSARQAIARASQAAGRAGTREYAWLLDELKGRIAETSRDVETAARAYRRAIGEVEKRRASVRDPAWRAAALEDRIAPYRALSRLLRESGRVDDAWLVARAGKGRSFVESLPAPRLAAPGDVGEAIEASGEIPRPSEASTLSLQTLLHEGEALVDFYVDGGAITAFVLRKDGLRSRSLTLGEDASDLLRTAQWPGRPGDTAVTQAWRHAVSRLGAMLFEPLQADLAGVHSLLIVPSGALYGVPYGALEIDGQPLVSRFDLALLPAAEGLLSRRRSGSGSGLLALGDPRVPGGEPLPAAAAEAKAVAALRAGGTAYVGAGATEAAFKRRAPRAEWIHLAAHGRVDPLVPGRSHLLLAPGEGEDGRLEAAEITALNLTATLVVLSACDSGVEAGLARQDAPGDERSGLPRAFLTAGAGTVIENLWEVDDAASRVLLSAFYARLDEASIPKALARLQRDAAAGRFRDVSGRSLAHPYYWAGLSAYGAGFGSGADASLPATLSAR
ncbi:MAG TPA: CHAT domain-containing tetratricopeptide repeat protein [Candidatus Polarisedimenticolia bacterium]|nr:CHAT domain-containing tetratricopeptide repeat protein [Candidatus Polarisedimenticolia bacterium]